MKKIILILMVLFLPAMAYGEIKTSSTSSNAGTVSGNFTQTGTLGTDSIVNGTFAADASWTKGTNWTIAAGVAAKSTGTAANLSEIASTVVAGKYYKLTFDVPTLTVSTMTPSAGGWTGAAVSVASTGIVSYFYALSTAAVTFAATATTVGTIDNVILQEISASALFDDAFLTSASDDPLIFKKVLNKATGDQRAFHFVYEVNKATSGNDTGFLITMLDTASPGTSKPFDVNVGGVSEFSVDSSGNGVFNNQITGSIVNSNSIRANGNNASLALQASRTFSSTNSYNIVDLTPGSISTTSNQINVLQIAPTYAQASGTAANTDLLINRTQTQIGSGLQYLIATQVGGALALALTNKGHVIVDDAVANSYPALTTCGNSPTLTAGSNDYAGTFTIGATGTGCTITFGTSYTNAPSCVVSGGAAITNSQTASVLTVVAVAGTYNYHCIGLNGGI